MRHDVRRHQQRLAQHLVARQRQALQRAQCASRRVQGIDADVRRRGMRRLAMKGQQQLHPPLLAGLDLEFRRFANHHRLRRANVQHRCQRMSLDDFLQHAGRHGYAALQTIPRSFRHAANRRLYSA